MSDMNPLIPGVLMALEDDRTTDAVLLVQQLLEEHPAEMAVLQVAVAANLLHANPSMSLKQLSTTLSMPGGIDVDRSGLENGRIALEILDVIEGMTGPGEPSEEGQAILERFDHRPGSATIMEWLCKVVDLLLQNMMLQEVAVKSGLRSMKSARQYSFDHVRAVMSSEPPPNVFSADYDDLA